MNHSVKFHNVTKKYKMHSKNSDKLKDILYPGGFGEDFYAVRNMSFRAHKGDVIGIIGVNGSGKSTISNLIAGITPPTSGEIEVDGQVSLIAIAAGLNNQLTGRENIELKCLMMGLDKEEIYRITPEIIDFADIGKFIDMPVKKYSSGMKSRLGFAISVSIDPDVLVIDEALSVGDQTFTDKCLKRMNEFKEQGKTIFFVSHSLGQVKTFCTKALWLEYGEIRDYGPIQEIMPKYESFLKEYKAMSPVEQRKFKQEAMEKQAGRDMMQVKGSDHAPLFFASRLKKKKKRKYVASVMSLALCLAAGGLIYTQKDSIVHSLQAKEKREVQTDRNKDNEKKAAPKVKNPLADLDVRYVNTIKARVRNTPALDAQQIAVMDFGTSFVVQDKKSDEKSGANWLKVIFNNGQEGWISETVVSSISFQKALAYEDAVNKIKALEGLSPHFEQSLSFLEKRKEEITNILDAPQTEKNFPEGTLAQYKNIDVLYNKKLEVKQITLRNTTITKSALLEHLGETQLKGEDPSTYVYRSDKYDFKFSSNGSTIHQLLITDVLK